MARIVLIDQISTGHHRSYATVLAQCLNQDGHEVIAVGEHKLIKELKNVISEAIPIVINKNNNFIQLEVAKYLFFRRAIERARGVGADIVHFLYIDRFIWALALNSLPKARIRATLHWGYILPRYSTTPLKSIRSATERIALQSLGRRRLRVMVHSQWLQKSLIHYIGQDMFDYVPYPVKSPIIINTGLKRRAIRERFGLGNDSRLALVFGGTRHDKGADLAVRAMAYLDSQWHLLIAGRAEYFDENTLHRLADQLGVENRVHLNLEYIPDDHLIDYFIAADVVLLPYRPEFSGQSGPLVLAASLGVPVAAAKVPILSETVEAYKLGELFTPGNVSEMAHAIQHLALQQAQSRQGDFSKDHSPQAFINSIISSYFK